MITIIQFLVILLLIPAVLWMWATAASTLLMVGIFL